MKPFQMLRSAHPLQAGALSAGFAMLVTLVFWAALPGALQANESADYTGFYAPVARNLLDGKGMVTSSGDFAMRYPPGYPMILAGVFQAGNWLGVPQEISLSIFLLLCAGAAAWLIYAIAARVWGSLWAFLPAAAWSTYPFALWLSKQPNSEMVYIPLILGGFALVFPALKTRGELWRSLAAGLLCGAAVLVRPAGVAVAGAFVFILLFVLPSARMQSRLLAALLFLAGALLVIAPWQAALCSCQHCDVFLSTGGALSLRDGFSYADNEVTGSYFPPPPPAVEALAMRLLDATSGADGVGSLLAAIATQSVRQPGAVIQWVALKAARSWYANESGRLEFATLALQIPYLAAALLAFARCLKIGAAARNLALCAGLVVITTWAITLMALSILRYMTPALAFLFLLLPAIFARARRDITLHRSLST